MNILKKKSRSTFYQCKTWQETVDEELRTSLLLSSRDGMPLQGAIFGAVGEDCLCVCVNQSLPRTEYPDR